MQAKRRNEGNAHSRLRRHGDDYIRMSIHAKHVYVHVHHPSPSLSANAQRQEGVLALASMYSR